MGKYYVIMQILRRKERTFFYIVEGNGNENGKNFNVSWESMESFGRMSSGRGWCERERKVIRWKENVVLREEKASGAERKWELPKKKKSVYEEEKYSIDAQNSGTD